MHSSVRFTETWSTQCLGLGDLSKGEVGSPLKALGFSVPCAVICSASYVVGEPKLAWCLCVWFICFKIKASD